jgi:hypothetical protein
LRKWGKYVALACYNSITVEVIQFEEYESFRAGAACKNTLLPTTSSVNLKKVKSFLALR